jgi:hypothetical protein
MTASHSSGGAVPPPATSQRASCASVAWRRDGQLPGAKVRHAVNGRHHSQTTHRPLISSPCMLAMYLKLGSASSDPGLSEISSAHSVRLRTLLPMLSPWVQRAGVASNTKGQAGPQTSTLARYLARYLAVTPQRMCTQQAPHIVGVICDAVPGPYRGQTAAPT